MLALVPRSGLDADDLAEMLHEATGGKFVKALTRDERLALQGAITSCGEWSGTDAPIIALREFIAAGAPGMPTSQLSLEDRARGRTGISPALISTPGWLSEAIGKAVDWKVRQDRSLQMFAESRKQLGFE